MINYEKQYKQTSKTRYAEDYVDYDPAMTVSQNAYAREDYMQRETTQTKTSTADFEQMIDAASAQSVDLNARDLYPSPTTHLPMAFLNLPIRCQPRTTIVQ
jgi:hypothetical protein